MPVLTADSFRALAIVFLAARFLGLGTLLLLAVLLVLRVTLLVLAAPVFADLLADRFPGPVTPLFLAVFVAPDVRPFVLAARRFAGALFFLAATRAGDLPLALATEAVFFASTRFAGCSNRYAILPFSCSAGMDSALL